MAEVEHREGCPGPHPCGADGTCEAWCWGHMRCEWLGRDVEPYAGCFECGHVWPTEADLVADDLAVRIQMWENPMVLPGDPPGGHDMGPRPEPRADADILVCPVCVHDL